MTLGTKKLVLGAVCLLPLIWLVANLVSGGMGANPIEATNRFLGDWALRFLLLALSVTPLRILFKWQELARFRRMLGLFAFFYLSMHVTNYVVIDQFFDWSEIWIDITKRIFMTAGMTAFVILLCLALTSTDGMARRMGGRRWRALHRAVYAAGVLGVVHFFMMVKADVTEPVIYAIVLALLLAIRLPGLRAGLIRG